jgi:uncharacterized membrane protein
VATFTVWKFHTADGAESALDTLERLQSEELIKVQDAAVVSWPEDKKKPRTRHLNDLTGAGALGGAFWGFLFGLIFFVPLLGLAVGAATGALAGSLTKVGIDEDFVSSIREKITPGTSALFVMTSDAVIDKVREAFPAADAELIHTNLSNEDETALRQAFSEEE